MVVVVVGKELYCVVGGAFYFDYGLYVCGLCK